MTLYGQEVTADKNFNVPKLMKLFIDAIGQDAFADFYGTNWQARKKEIQKLQKTEITQEKFERFVNMLNDWANWAEKNNYINSWDNHSICTLFSPLAKSMVYPRRECLKSDDFISFSIMWAICFMFQQMFYDLKERRCNDTDYELLKWTLSAYNFWISYGYNDYENEVSAIGGVFKLFLEYLVKDGEKQTVVEYWNKRKGELQNKDNAADIRVQIERWIKGKQQPTWKMVKMLFNEDLKPDDSLLVDLFDEETESYNYLVFRRKLFPACFITKFFNSLKEQKVISQEMAKIIKHGVIMFYRHFFARQPLNLHTQEEISNPMYCMLVHFLVYFDMGKDIETDADFYFFRIYNLNNYYQLARGV